MNAYAANRDPDTSTDRAALGAAPLKKLIHPPGRARTSAAASRNPTLA